LYPRQPRSLMKIAKRIWLAAVLSVACSTSSALVIFVASFSYGSRTIDDTIVGPHENNFIRLMPNVSSSPREGTFSI
jgi:hypothetical protein